MLFLKKILYYNVQNNHPSKEKHCNNITEVLFSFYLYTIFSIYSYY